MQTARTSLPISIPAHRSTAARIIIGSFPTDSSQRLVHNFFLGPTAPFKGALRQPGQFCLREKKILAVTQGSHPARWPSAYAHPRLFSSPWVAARSWMFCFVKAVGSGAPSGRALALAGENGFVFSSRGLHRVAEQRAVAPRRN